MLKLIINCGPAERYVARCLASVQSQSFTAWQAFVTIDPCLDATRENAVAARAGDPRIDIHCPETRRFSMTNLIHGIHRSAAEAEDVIVVLDGDDWLATPDALRIIADTYRRSGCWMTYGSWISDHPGMPGRWPAYPDDLTDFRSFEWLGTAVRTWKRWLWDLIDESDFRGEDRRLLRVTEDQAVMLPMLEMSGTARAKHIEDILMVYNRSSPHACAYVCRDEMLANTDYIRALPPYPKLAKKPGSAASAAIRAQRASLLKRWNSAAD